MDNHIGYEGFRLFQAVSLELCVTTPRPRIFVWCFILRSFLSNCEPGNSVSMVSSYNGEEYSKR
jgi:hypothetical protein